MIVGPKFRALEEAAGDVTQVLGAVHFAPGTVYATAADYVVEASGWITLYPLGSGLRNTWLFTKRVTTGAAEAWFWAVPTDRVADLVALRPVWEAIAGDGWTLEALRADTSPEAEAIKAAWIDERPDRIVRVGGTDDDPTFENQGPDPARERVAVYRGIGTFRGA